MRPAKADPSAGTTHPEAPAASAAQTRQGKVMWGTRSCNTIRNPCFAPWPATSLPAMWVALVDPVARIGWSLEDVGDRQVTDLGANRLFHLSCLPPELDGGVREAPGRPAAGQHKRPESRGHGPRSCRPHQTTGDRRPTTSSSRAPRSDRTRHVLRQQPLAQRFSSTWVARMLGARRQLFLPRHGLEVAWMSVAADHQVGAPTRPWAVG